MQDIQFVINSAVTERKGFTLIIWCIQVPKVQWSDVGGLEGVKQGLKEAVQWPHLHPDALTRLGAQPPRGTLTLTILLALPKHSAFILNRICFS